MRLALGFIVYRLAFRGEGWGFRGRGGTLSSVMWFSVHLNGGICPKLLGRQVELVVESVSKRLPR